MDLNHKQLCYMKESNFLTQCPTLDNGNENECFELNH